MKIKGKKYRYWEIVVCPRCDNKFLRKNKVCDICEKTVKEIDEEKGNKIKDEN